MNRRNFLAAAATMAVLPPAHANGEVFEGKRFDLGADGSMVVYQTSAGVCIDYYEYQSSCAAWRSEMYSNGRVNSWDGAFNNSKTFELR